jgi:hypothetical protein
MRHELKTWPEYFNEVIEGRKRFEIRKNDRNYNVDDELILQEWDPATKEYTGWAAHVQVTYILDNPDFVKDGLVVMSIEPLDVFNGPTESA